MLNGKNCFQTNVTIDMLTFAVKRLRKMLFVGIFEHYESSVLKFHKLINPNSTYAPHPIELEKMRTTSSYYHVRDLLLNTTYDDPYDSELYKHAVPLFSMPI